MKNVVVIGGGTGTFTLLSGLKKYPLHLSVIVSTADDGGSTGRLRKELGVFPPGDIRQCLLGLSMANPESKDLFAYRFGSGELAGHAAGNIIIAALEKIAGGIETAIEQAGKPLKVRGAVIPATLRPAVLVAGLANGKKLIGQHSIDEAQKHPYVKITRLTLKPQPAANPKALFAIKQANMLVLGPGDLYTSILPNVIVPEIRRAIAAARAKKIYVTNLMTKYGQTEHFKASDFVGEMVKYLGSPLHAVIVNDQKPSQQWLGRYRKERGEFVWPDISKLAEWGMEIHADNFLADYVFYNQPGDKLKRSLLRHNAEKLAKVIYRLTKIG